MVSSHVKCLFSYVQLVINYGEGGGGVWSYKTGWVGAGSTPIKKGGGAENVLGMLTGGGGGHKLI